MTTMSRQALFEAAWTRPLTEIAAEFGISDVGLRKICDRHDIPTPGRGYWAQVRAGKTFPRPKLRPVRDPRLEQVQIAGGRPLPPVVVEAMQKAREAPVSAAPVQKTPRRLKGAPPEPASPGEAVAPAPEPPAQPLFDEDRKELSASRKALARARPDSSGFVSVSGASVVPMKIGLESQAAALRFLAALLAQADLRGWALELTQQGARLKVDGETLAFRLEESPTKTPHEPTPKQLAEKVRRDRWGGDSQPWPTWDLSPSGRLAFIIEENSWSGLRRTYSQRKGFAFVDSLEAVVAGLAGHAAFKAERRREDEARAKAAAIAEAQRQRLQAFDKREARRAEFVAAVQAQLAERDRLAAVLAHLEAQVPDQRRLLEAMEAWLRRRLRAIDALLEPSSLAVSARHADVGFEEPPSKPQPAYWYPRKIELEIWKLDAAEEVFRAASELDWAIAEGLIGDPRRDPEAESNPASEMSD